MQVCLPLKIVDIFSPCKSELESLSLGSTTEPTLVIYERESLCADEHK